jgi:predicted DCC family thiol-disulfide oxidoreductase YuxK
MRSLKDFYFTIDQRSIDLFRILLAVVLIGDWVARWPGLEAFYTGQGVLPASAAGFHFSLLDSITSLPGVQAVFLVGLLAYVLLLVGYRTRLALVVSFIFFMAALNRNMMIRNGGDVVALTMFWWLLWLPVGRRFSLDAIRAALKQGVPIRPRVAASSPDERSAPSLAAFVIIAQIGIIYLLTAAAKSGVTWWDGTALYYTLNYDQAASPLGQWLSAQPLFLIKVLTWGTLALEFAALPLLLLPVGQPWLRRLAILLLVPLHLGIWLTMNLGSFSFVMIAAYALLLSSREWAWFAAPHRPLTVYYDDTCGFCHRCAQLLVMADRKGNLRFIGNHDTGAFQHPLTAAELEDSIVVFDDLTGERTTRTAAAVAIFRALPRPFHALRVIGLPGLRRVSDVVYNFVARHRYRFSAWLGFTACGIERVRDDATPTPVTRPPARLFTVDNFIVAVVFTTLLFDGYNQTLAPGPADSRLPVPRVLRGFIYVTRIQHEWRMFAPNPIMNDGWWVVDGVTELGASLDPFTGMPPTFEKAPNLERDNFDRFWRKYLFRLTDQKNADYRRYLADYLVYLNRRDSIVGERLVRFDIYYIKERTQPPGTPRPWPTERLLLWHQECPLDAPRAYTIP